MPQVKPITAITFAQAAGNGGDVSAWIAPPYDVLDEGPKQALLGRCPTNIVKIDLPQTPPKTVAPEPVYAEAGRTYRQWLEQGVLCRADKPAVFVYQQSYTHGGRSFARCGLIANIVVQPFGPSPTGGGGVFAHENTIASGKEDRLRLMRATCAQLSPIFGIYSDPRHQVGPLLEAHVQAGPPSFTGVTDHDGVHHDVWRVEDPRKVEELTSALSGYDIFIADGHHRYNTAINYQKEVPSADQCMFVLVSMQDPGMIVLPTHRVICGLAQFTMSKLRSLVDAGEALRLKPASTQDLDALAASLPNAGHHAMGLYDPATRSSWVLTATSADPLAPLMQDRPAVWRELDVAVLHELVMKRVLEPNFGGGGQAVSFKYTAELAEMRRLTEAEPSRLGVIVQPTPVDSVRRVSEAGELMPAKSTFFYPKLATGLVINPLDGGA